MRLTTKGIETARPADVRREIPDAYMRGLYLIIQPTGSKSWAVRCRLGGKPIKHTIGPYPAFGLKEARDAAARVLRGVSEGRGPASARVETVAQGVEQFLARHCKNYRPSTLYAAKHWLRHYVVGAWGGRRLDHITRADIRTLLASIEGPVAANRVHSIVSTFFKWCVANDLLSSSPAANLAVPNKETSRERVLTDAELRRVWQAAEAIGFPYGTILQLLILTGQRRGEVTGMMWSELDLEAATWSLPRERVKNNRQHEVPLSHQALAILKQVPRIGARHVFSLNGSGPYSGFKRKARLDQLAGVHGWTVHDLRRTVATGLQRLGIRLEVTEATLNHASGSRGGIVGIYQRHEYADEKRIALQQWADYVEDLSVLLRHATDA